MDNKRKIEIALEIVHGTANKELVRQQDSQADAPTYTQKQREREGSSSWSGGSAGGGVWAGRSR